MLKVGKTFDDLLATPDDGNLHELVRGEIVRMPPPQGPHGRVESRLGHILDTHLDRQAEALGWDGHDQDARDLLVGFVLGGEAGVKLGLPDDPDQVRGIDLAYLGAEQARRYIEAGASGYLAEAPVLTIEVVSPTDRAAKIDEKVSDYLAGGALLVWLLFPERRIARIFRADGTTSTVSPDGMLSGEQVLPGFTISLARLFPAPRS